MRIVCICCLQPHQSNFAHYTVLNEAFRQGTEGIFKLEGFIHLRQAVRGHRLVKTTPFLLLKKTYLVKWSKLKDGMKI